MLELLGVDKYCGTWQDYLRSEAQGVYWEKCTCMEDARPTKSYWETKSAGNYPSSTDPAYICAQRHTGLDATSISKN